MSTGLCYIHYWPQWEQTSINSSERSQDFIHRCCPTHPMLGRHTLHQKMAATVYLTRHDLFSISVTRGFNKQQEPDTRCPDEDNRWVTNTRRRKVQHQPFPGNMLVFLHIPSCHLWQGCSVQIKSAGILLEIEILLTFKRTLINTFRNSVLHLHSKLSCLHFDTGCGAIYFLPMFCAAVPQTHLEFPACAQAPFNLLFVLWYTCMFEKAWLRFGANEFKRQ